jgi:hypothetical protein
MAATGKGRDDPEAGSSMCVTPHAMHRDQRGRTIRRVRRPGRRPPAAGHAPIPPAAPRSQGRTNPLFQHPLDAPGVVAYREHRCSYPHAALPEASAKDHGEGCPGTDTLTVSSRTTPRNRNTGKTSPLTLNDAHQPRHAHG